LDIHCYELVIQIEYRNVIGYYMTDRNNLTLTVAADMVGIKGTMLRRWAEYHKDYLSPGANPLAGVTRRFTSRDVEILKYIAELRSQGLTVGGINVRLATLTFPDIEENEQNSDLVPEADTTEIALSTKQEGLQSTQAIVVALQLCKRK